MAGDASNRRNFLKVMGLTAVGMALTTDVGIGVAGAAAPTAADPDAAPLELWLLGTGAATLDTGLYVHARQELDATLASR
jgi:hypothetical protein